MSKQCTVLESQTVIKASNDFSGGETEFTQHAVRFQDTGHLISCSLFQKRDSVLTWSSHFGKTQPNVCVRITASVLLSWSQRPLSNSPVPEHFQVPKHNSDRQLIHWC